jgi:hypothetical protein
MRAAWQNTMMREFSNCMTAIWRWRISTPDIGEPSGGTFLELMMQKKKLKFPPNTKPYKELEATCR